MKKNQNDSLTHQLNTFFTLQSKRVQHHYHNQGTKKNIARLFEWANAFGERYIESRIERARDLQSEDIQRARKLARAYIGENNHDFFATCVDGRNMPTVMFSKPPHVGGVLRAPAGVVTGFMEGQQPGTVFIDHSSFVVKQITKLLEERAGETIFYGLDSHLGCAARGLIHSTEGGEQKDSGLYSDVRSKWMTANGIVALRQSLISQKKKTAEVIPVFFSYDPHSGGVVAGLETHINDPKVVEEGFTESLLDSLASEGKIVRTIDLLEDPQVLSELKRVMEAGSADFRQKFGKSMYANWKAITQLYDNGTGSIYEKIHAMLVKVYAASGWEINDVDSLTEHMISKRTLKQKAKFLLKNLLTRYSIAGASHKWVFGHHKEDLVVITDGGYAPFSNLDAFAVFSRDLNALLPNTKLTIDLIRGFRRSQGVTNPVTDMPLTLDEFVSAPVLISNKAVFRHANKELFEAMSKIPLVDYFGTINWDDPAVLSWTKADIATLLRKSCANAQIVLPVDAVLGLVDVLFELYERLNIMMKDKYFRHMILNGNIVVVNTIVDTDRCPYIVVPFVV